MFGPACQLRSADLETATARLKLTPRGRPIASASRPVSRSATAATKTASVRGAPSSPMASGGEQLKKFGHADDREPANGTTI